MALDIYVGPLSRYHALNWKNLGQQAAEASGIGYELHRANDNGSVASQEEVTEAVRLWKMRLRDALEAQGDGIPDWEEDGELGYETDRPGWPGLLATILKGAYLLHPDLTQPTNLPPEDQFNTDPAFRRCQAEPSLLSLLSDGQLWLPGDFGMLFHTQTVTGAELGVSSVGGLIECLKDIAGRWGRDAYEMVEADRDQPHSSAPIDEHAAYGLACMMRMALAAQRLHQPMILDW